jgi:ketosteroid isomerase-like protein
MFDIKAEKLAIEQLVKRVEEAENRHDVEAMLDEMIAEPVLHVCGVPPVKGQDAVRQLYQVFFETFVSTDIASKQIFVSSSSEMAWDYGTYVNEFEGPDGRIKEHGKYLGVYHKVNGIWRGAAFCITPNGNSAGKEMK